MYACEPPAHEMHTREMYTREIYAHHSVAFLGRGVPRAAVFTLASDDDVDSLHRTMSTSNSHHG
jgi:hypothetical protein